MVRIPSSRLGCASGGRHGASDTDSDAMPAQSVWPGHASAAGAGRMAAQLSLAALQAWPGGPAGGF